MKKIAIYSLLFVLTGCASSSEPSIALNELPKCAPPAGYEGEWPVQTWAVSMGDNTKVFEMCLLGDVEPEWPTRDARTRGGPGIARLRDRETGKVLHEKPFEKLDIRTSDIFFMANGDVWYRNGTQETGLSPAGTEPVPPDPSLF